MAAQLQVITEQPIWPPRPADSNKGDFGKILVVAGSRGMAGAAILTATAALRSGAGLVRVAIPQEIACIVAAGNPCYTTMPLPNDENGKIGVNARDELVHALPDHNVVAAGPGLGRSNEMAGWLSELLQQCQVPMILDADGINAFAGRADDLANHSAPLIITPHPGEFARLNQKTTQEIQNERVQLASDFAEKYNLIVVLKGHGSIVTDGRRLYRNPTGNPGMATGGAGDVLTGVIAALVGQGLESFAAAQLGVYLHGRAGDIATKNLGEASLIATDLIDYLPRAFQEC